MSGEAIGWAFRKVKIDDPTAKLVLVALCNYANENDEAWPSHASVAEVTGLSKRAVQNSIKKLEAWGVISRIRQDRTNGSETSAKVFLDIEKTFDVRGIAPDAIVAGDATPIAGGAMGIAPGAIGGMAPGATLETTLFNQQGNHIKQTVASEVLACPHDWPSDFENQWWKTYPRREDKKPAMKSLNRIAKAGKTAWTELIEGTQHYADHMRGKETRFIKLPATFLNAESWKNRYNGNHERPKSFLEAVTADLWPVNNGAGNYHDD